jgi:drug/metabolite transporter (DMT)-like permease
MSGEASIFWISANSLIRSLARGSRSLVLSARTGAAFVSTAGASTRDSEANALDGNRRQVDVAGVGRKQLEGPPYRARAVACYSREVPRSAETAALTTLALVAFAANSILNRMALAGHSIDAASFTAIRLTSGALVLVALVRARAGDFQPLGGRDWRGPLALLAYAAPFSFAYLRLGAAVGALVLFGSVQLTMIGWALARGERPTPRVWTGLALAAGGLGMLMLPAATRPDPLGAVLMIAAGAAWGGYSLAGKRATDPLAANARGFVRATPLAIVLVLARAATGASLVIGARGAALAVASGAVTSALGYAVWYRALRGLTATQAAIVQLAVPVLAGLGAVALLGEHPSERLIVAAAAVLGGVALVLSRRPAR